MDNPKNERWNIPFIKLSRLSISYSTQYSFNTMMERRTEILYIYLHILSFLSVLTESRRDIMPPYASILWSLESQAVDIFHFTRVKQLTDYDTSEDWRFYENNMYDGRIVYYSDEKFNIFLDLEKTISVLNWTVLIYGKYYHWNKCVMKVEHVLVQFYRSMIVIL